MEFAFALACLIQTWDEKADAEAALVAACEKARDDNRRVLVAFGSDDDASRAFAEILQKDRAVARKILYEYVPVYVHRKSAGLAILASDARELARAEALDAKSILALLEKHQCEPQKAQDVLDSAIDRAENGRRVLLVFGAPW
jgi:hypothetical protein